MSEMQEPKPVSEVPAAAPSGAPVAPRRRPAPGIVWPLILIFVGVMLLLNTTHVLSWNVWWRLWMLWPLLLILIGLDILLRHSALALRIVVGLVMVGVLVVAGIYMVTMIGPASTGITLEKSWSVGEADRGQVTLRAGVSRLYMGSVEEGGTFAQVTLRGWNSSQEPSFRQQGGVDILEIVQNEPEMSRWFGFWEEDIRWDVALTTRMPLTLDIDTGVGESHLDLGNLQVTDLKLNTGVGETTVTLPGQVERGRVRIHTGIGAVHIVIPEGIAVQIETHTGIGSASVSSGRFPRAGDDLYRSRDYDTARYRLDINIEGGIGSIDVR